MFSIPTESDEEHQKMIAKLQKLRSSLFDDTLLSKIPFERIPCGVWNVYDDLILLIFELYELHFSDGPRWKYLQNYVYRHHETVKNINNANNDLTEASYVVIRDIMGKISGCKKIRIAHAK